MPNVVLIHILMKSARSASTFDSGLNVQMEQFDLDVHSKNWPIHVCCLTGQRKIIVVQLQSPEDQDVFRHVFSSITHILQVVVRDSAYMCVCVCVCAVY